MESSSFSKIEESKNPLDLKIADDIFSRSLQQRNELFKNRTFKDIFVWSQESKANYGRSCHTAIIFNDKLIIIGGMDDRYPNQIDLSDDLVIYDLKKYIWHNIEIKSNPKSSSQFGRYAHACALHDSKLYVFGGHLKTQKQSLCLNDIGYIDLKGHSFELSEDIQPVLEFQTLQISARGMEEEPSPRFSHSFDSVTQSDSNDSTKTNQQLWIFGGTNSIEFFNDMYYFDFTELCWHRVNYDYHRSMAIPTPRCSHSLIYFSNNNSLYMFGGGNSHQFFNDLFIFDIKTRIWILPSVSGEVPALRAGHTATKIGDSHFCIIGGGVQDTVFNDIFLFNVITNNWIKVKAAGQLPERRCGHSATKVDSKILIFGGGEVDGKIFGDLQSFDLSYMVPQQKLLREVSLPKYSNTQQQAALVQELEQISLSRTSRRRAKKKQQKNSLYKQQQTKYSQEIQKIKSQLREEHDYYNKQFKLMANLLQDMQNKCEYFFNKYSQQLDKLEEKMNDSSNPNSRSYSDISDCDSSFISTSSNDLSNNL